MVSCLTLFNLAGDATEREVHVLFSGCPGYSRCAIVPPKEYAKPYAFVQFDTPENALAAMEARQGTAWDTNMPPVRFELSKKNMPDHFGPRQVSQPSGFAEARPQYVIGAGAWQQNPPQPAVVVGSQQPAAKRPRVEAGGGSVHVPAPPPAPARTVPPPGVGAVGGGAAVAPAAAAGERPRTLHVGGLPAGLTQGDLDQFLANQFQQTITGSRLHEDGGSGPGRAFVGFTSHWAANTAMTTLQGFDWDGATLQASWARKELNVQHVAATSGAPPPPDSAAATYTGPPGSAGRGGKGCGKNHDAGLNGGGWHGHGGEQKGGKCTLHITGLPFIDEEDFRQLLHELLGGDVVGSRFVDKHDGRPPVAWVRLADEGAAELVASCGLLDFGGTQAAVGFARTELDITKMSR